MGASASENRKKKQMSYVVANLCNQNLIKKSTRRLKSLGKDGLCSLVI